MSTSAHENRRGIRTPRVLTQVLLGRQLALTVVTVLLFVFFSVFAEYFFELANIYDMGRVATYMLIVGVPLTFLFIAGELDLSVGANFALCQVVMALLVVDGVGVWLAAGAAVALGAFIGLVNGVVTVLGVPSFIVTLGMFSLIRGIAVVATASVPVIYPEGLESSFFSAVDGQIGDFPVQIFWGVGVVLFGLFLLRYTRFGAHIYATGGNPKAARASGIATTRVKLACFVLTGAGCGLIGAMEGGWLREGNPTAGTGFELQVIAAVIIGGVALTGGEGSVYGTFLGAWIIVMLYNGLVLLGVQGNWNQIFVGLLIVTVAASEVVLNRRSEIGASLRGIGKRSRRRRTGASPAQVSYAQAEPNPRARTDESAPRDMEVT